MVWTSSAGVANTCATQLDVSLSCWGVNDHGQLGRGTPPRPASRPGQARRHVWTDHERRRAALLRDPAPTRPCGAGAANLKGELGDHGLGDRYLPTPVDALTNWIAVSDGGGSQTCAHRPADRRSGAGARTRPDRSATARTSNRTLPVQIGISSWAIGRSAGEGLHLRHPDHRRAVVLGRRTTTGSSASRHHDRRLKPKQVGFSAQLDLGRARATTTSAGSRRRAPSGAGATTPTVRSVTVRRRTRPHPCGWAARATG